MKATFENSVNILVKAFLNDTLRFMSCEACAVGNIIAANGYKFNIGNSDEWLKAIICDARGESQYIYNQTIAQEQINLSGYTVHELSRIEHAFEQGKYAGGLLDEGRFEGLMNVVDTLAEIHGIDLKEKENAKAMFVKV